MSPAVAAARSNWLSAHNYIATHDWEHYGNIVTHMRMKGLVPPSSQNQ